MPNDPAGFFEALLKRELPGHPCPRVLDFGCGGGELMDGLRARGFNTEGCDVQDEFSVMSKSGRTSGVIQLFPYRLPYDDAEFDAVISNQVIEHVTNKQQAISEIDRILKPGGVTIHVFPSKWYLPFEPHLRVPFGSWLWPHVPLWYLKLWARLGLRNEYQAGMSRDQVVSQNESFLRGAVHYIPNRQIERLFADRFARVVNDASFYFSNPLYGPDRVLSRLTRRLPMAGALSAIRQRVIVANKAA